MDYKNIYGGHIYNVGERVQQLKQSNKSKLCRIDIKAWEWSSFPYPQREPIPAPLNSQDFSLNFWPIRNRFLVQMNINEKHFSLNGDSMLVVGENIVTYLKRGSGCDCPRWVDSPGVIQHLKEIRDGVFAIKSYIKCNMSLETPVHRLHVDIDVVGRYGDSFKTDYGFIMDADVDAVSEGLNLKTWIDEYALSSINREDN